MSSDIEISPEQTISSMQVEHKAIQAAKKGQEVACSVQDITIGRQIFEEDIFYSFPPSHEAKQLLGKFAHKLSPEETAVLNEIVEIQRKRDAAYAY